MTAYGPLLRTPGAPAFSAAALVGRLPISMLGIGSVLLVEDRRGSYALAGAVTAAYALGLAAVGPLTSRLVDRLGQGRILPVAALVWAVALAALVALAGTDVPAAVLLAVAFVVGAALPQLGSCVRARWGDTLARAGRDDELSTAFALESVVDEVVFVLGPLLVVACAALVDPALGLVAALVLGLGGTLAFAAQRATEPAVAPTSGSGRSALRVPGVQVLSVSLAAVGVVFGAAEVVMVAFAEQRGSASGGGLLLALVALGSAGAGLAYGAVTFRTALPRRYLLGLLGLAVGVVPLLLAPSVALMAPAALLAGIAISPTLIASFGLVESLVPLSARTEGFTWLNSGLGVGVAGGSALGGALAEGVGARPAFAVCVAGAVLALAAAVVGRRALVPAAGAEPLSR